VDNSTIKRNKVHRMNTMKCYKSLIPALNHNTPNVTVNKIIQMTIHLSNLNLRQTLIILIFQVLRAQVYIIPFNLLF